MKQTGARFNVLGNIPDDNVCVIKNVLKIEWLKATKLPPDPITLNCFKISGTISPIKSNKHNTYGPKQPS